MGAKAARYFDVAVTAAFAILGAPVILAASSHPRSGAGTGSHVIVGLAVLFLARERDLQAGPAETLPRSR